MLNKYKQEIFYTSKTTRTKFSFVKSMLLIKFFVLFTVVTIFFESFIEYRAVIILAYFLSLILKTISLFYKPESKIDHKLKDIKFLKSVEEKCSMLNLNYENLPIYTMLLPVYKENRKTIENLINSISKIYYNPSKLDIKFLTEEKDIETIENIKSLKYPATWELIILPDEENKTKGRALNIGLIISRGEYLTVFDAEDIPSPEQLLCVLYRFNNLSEKYISIQCNLSFYNKVNWISNFMNSEYNYVFKKRNVITSNLLGFIFLGGTSNHFKVEKLIECGGWEASNVTEDAELAINIFAQNYKISHLDIETLEESVVTKKAWIKQRSRWIKGYMQTYFSYFRSFIWGKRKKTKNQKINKSIFRIILTHLFINMYFVITLFMPVFWIGFSFRIIYEVILFLLNPELFTIPIIETIVLCFYIILMSFLIKKLTYISSKDRDVNYNPILDIFYSIIYSTMYTVAFLKAFYEIMTKKVFWEKTHHSGEYYSEILPDVKN